MKENNAAAHTIFTSELNTYQEPQKTLVGGLSGQRIFITNQSKSAAMIHTIGLYFLPEKTAATYNSDDKLHQCEIVKCSEVPLRHNA